jgi:hypothetical protein
MAQEKDLFGFLAEWREGQTLQNRGLAMRAALLLMHAKASGGSAPVPMELQGWIGDIEYHMNAVYEKKP